MHQVEAKSVLWNVSLRANADILSIDIPNEIGSEDEIVKLFEQVGIPCDQMTRLCFQYLAIYSNENLPKSIQIVPKWDENFAQNQINLKYNA